MKMSIESTFNMLTNILNSPKRHWIHLFFLPSLVSPLYLLTPLGVIPLIHYVEYRHLPGTNSLYIYIECLYRIVQFIGISYRLAITWGYCCCWLSRWSNFGYVWSYHFKRDECMRINCAAQGVSIKFNYSNYLYSG